VKSSLFIIGADHNYRRGYAPGYSSGAFEEFRQMLREFVGEKNIRGIGEEMNVDGLRTWAWAPDGTLASKIARELSISHRYCDAVKESPERVGTMTADERQRYWVKELQGFDGFPAIFICGADQVDGLKGRADDAGYQAEIVNRDWKPVRNRDGRQEKGI
jgi:hypothetical protein